MSSLGLRFIPLSRPQPPAEESFPTESSLGARLHVTRLRPTSPPQSPSQPSTPKLILSERSQRGLAVDVENKPGTYGPGDFTHAKVTAICAQWLDADEGMAWCLDRSDPDAMVRAAEEVRGMWERADFVLGHNIRRHDIPLLDGLYVSLGLPLLPRRRVVDLYRDQPRIKGLSRSLENLASRWGCPIPKLHLSEHDWEQAYDGIPEAVSLMRRRVVTDVKITIWLYHELRRRGLLAKEWTR